MAIDGFDKLKQCKIRFYLNIDQEIERLEGQVRLLQESFYDRTMTRQVFWTEEGIYSKSFNVEKEVVLHVYSMENLEKRIELLKKKKRYVNDYLQTLDPKSKENLINKYRNKNMSSVLTESELEFYDEILEIEEAINYMRGIEPDPSELISETIKLSNGSLEENFNNVLALLGV